MKLLVVSRGVRPISPNLAGGAEYALFNQAWRLAQSGHEVHVISDSEGSPQEAYPFTLHPVGVPLWFSSYCRGAGFALWTLLHLLGNFLAFVSALRVLRSSRGSFQVVHCHGNLSGLLLSFLCRDIPIVYTEHDSTPWACSYPSLYERLVRRAIYRLFNVALFHRAAMTLVLYPEHKSELVARWGIPAGRIAVAPNGVDQVAFQPLGDGQDKASVPGVSGFCLFVGRLEPRKGVDVLLRALTCCTVPCIVVGDGPERPRLEALASQLGLASRVVFTGAMKNGNLLAYYQKADCLVIPSLSEAFPLTALEAMACGVPVVASRVGALTSLVQENDCGLLFEPRDSRDLARKLQSLADEPGLARQLGANGRRAVLRSFTWDAVTSGVAGLYQDLGAARSGVPVGMDTQTPVPVAPESD